jgi:hypothetical protein
VPLVGHHFEIAVKYIRLYFKLSVRRIDFDKMVNFTWAGKIPESTVYLLCITKCSLNPNPLKNSKLQNSVIAQIFAKAHTLIIIQVLNKKV